jgi:hypothetical protein
MFDALSTHDLGGDAIELFRTARVAASGLRDPAAGVEVRA